MGRGHGISAKAYKVRIALFRYNSMQKPKPKTLLKNVTKLHATNLLCHTILFTHIQHGRVYEMASHNHNEY